MIKGQYTLSNSLTKEEHCFCLELTNQWISDDDFMDFYTPLVEELVKGHVVMHHYISSSDIEQIIQDVNKRKKYNDILLSLEGKSFSYLMPGQEYKALFGKAMSSPCFCTVRESFSKEMLAAHFEMSGYYTAINFYSDDKIKEDLKSEKEIVEYYSNQPSASISFDDCYLEFYSDERVCAPQLFLDAVRKIYGDKVEDFDVNMCNR